ncbi:MAG: bifunctional phosphoribosylaminoimidazolecarboxamide formyltransferase/IMP cyclohydrolase [Pedobacter sp.]|nr:MAG: bifunctional phosphoribosylaminoimidazolecarboxamide formyltransferase/IMP cyclohydrolase [Pedobacter sp.]
MDRLVQIKNALISVYHKDHLEPLIRQLHQLGVALYSTGGTYQFIHHLGIDAIAIEDISGYPSILGGRVKTLHPKIFGGILSRRENEADQVQLSEYEIPPIDLVIVDLYPFEDVAKSGALEEDCIEKIDIGGISLIRAAAKNYRDVVVAASADDYSLLSTILADSGGQTTLNQRKAFAKKAFHISSHYDATIGAYFDQQGTSSARELGNSLPLRYGENPHQKAFFRGDLQELFDQLHGKELSYNNLVDIDSAIALIDEFDRPTFALLKHTNACGLASRADLLDAWYAALACDPLSAFGGVLICNREIDSKIATEITKLFFEVLIAPSFEQEALNILSNKKNRILLKRKPIKLPNIQFKSLLNGVIHQDKDLVTEKVDQLKVVTDRKPTEAELIDLIFANKLVKHTKSNAIVLAKNTTLIASGIGQTSRIDALQQAITKAKTFGFDLRGSVMASDAFFPFPDCIELAAGTGIDMVIQPGGSIKDQESIDMADRKGIGMVTTGIRHFKH